LYKGSCVVCYGAGATGGVRPRLAANPILLDDQAFWKIVNQGLHVMPALNGNVSDQQIADIRAWLMTIR
jgi:mono/diheme cytochrome c family protein